MRVSLQAILVLLGLAVSAMGADHTPSPRGRAVLLREIRDQMDAARPASMELYQRYFDAFPASFAELGEVLVSDRYREILLRPGEKWDYGMAYVVTMCETYDRIDHRRYMRKLLRIGVGANDWGGRNKDREMYLYPGSIYQQLIFRYACVTRTDEMHREQLSVIYALLPEFDDAEIEAIYNSLARGEGFYAERGPLDWFLEGICARYPQRCELTRMLHEKYAKHLHEDPRPH